MNNRTYISVITTTLYDQNHISENCIGSVIYFYWSLIRLHGEGGVYDLYCSQPPGGDQRARSFTFKDKWDTPGLCPLNHKLIGYYLSSNQLHKRYLAALFHLSAQH